MSQEIHIPSILRLWVRQRQRRNGMHSAMSLAQFHSTQHLRMNEGAERHIMSPMGVRGSSFQSFFVGRENNKRKPIDEVDLLPSEDRFIAGK